MSENSTITEILLYKVVPPKSKDRILSKSKVFMFKTITMIHSYKKLTMEVDVALQPIKLTAESDSRFKNTL